VKSARVAVEGSRGRDIVVLWLGLGMDVIDGGLAVWILWWGYGRLCGVFMI
jgi:hypothetical protein